MDLQLAGKRALVTGSSSGIGVAIARALAAEGAKVVVHGLDLSEVIPIAVGITSEGGQALASFGDLTTDDGADAVAQVVRERLGGLDILVNNVGGSGTDARTWDQIPPEDFLASYNLNVVAALRMCQRFAPGMAERGWGRIINISSAVSRHAMGMMHDYAASKMAFENLSLNLSMNLAPKGVTVNTVVPGMILTAPAKEYIEKLGVLHGWGDDLPSMQAAYIREFSPQAVPRMGEPEEIAAAVTFLASPRSAYTTGAVLRVDGGMSKGL